MIALRQLLAHRPNMIYPIGFVLILLTTVLLYGIQWFMVNREGEHVNAYTIGFMLPIGLLASWGGRRAGLFGLLLSMAASIFILMDPHFNIGVKKVSDWPGVAFQLTTGALLIQAVDAGQRNKKLRVQAQAMARHERLINQIGQAIRTSTDPQEIQVTATTALGVALSADRCFFLVFLPKPNAAPEGNWPAASSLSAVPPQHLKSYERILRDLLKGGRPCAIADIETWAAMDEVRRVLRECSGRSSVSVPLFSQGPLTAVLVAAKNEPHIWTQGEVALAETVATQTRTALETARTLIREQTIATTLQEALQPPLPPSSPGLDIGYFYKAALDEAAIGGDFYDVFPIGPTQSVVIIADVSGKGLTAAAQIATVRNMLRYVLYQKQPLCRALSELNTVLTDNSLLSGFVTLFAGVFDAADGSLTYVSCGHEPALLRRSGSEHIEELPYTGPVLGVMSPVEYEARIVPFQSGDTLLLYTDGASDAGPNRNEMIGVEGLADLLRRHRAGERADQVVAHLVAGIKTHARGMQHDDLCLLALVAQQP